MNTDETERDEFFDEILDEIHKTRQRIAEKFGYDVEAIFEDAFTRQEASDWPIWEGVTQPNEPDGIPDDTPADQGPATPRSRESA